MFACFRPGANKNPKTTPSHQGFQTRARFAHLSTHVSPTFPPRFGMGPFLRCQRWSLAQIRGIYNIGVFSRVVLDAQNPWNLQYFGVLNAWVPAKMPEKCTLTSKKEENAIEDSVCKISYRLCVLKHGTPHLVTSNEK